MTTAAAAKFLDTTPRTIQRYAKSGKLTYTIVGTQKSFHKKDLLKIGVIIHGSNKGRSITPAPRASPQFSLNSTGEATLLNATKVLSSNNLLIGIDLGTVLRYATAVQMKEKFLAEAEASDEPKYSLDIVKQFQIEIQHYEKELGLTPASLRKIKPDQEEEIVIDPMEDILNG